MIEEAGIKKEIIPCLQEGLYRVQLNEVLGLAAALI